MSDYRLTRDAEADLLDIFFYGFESFGPGRAATYRDGLTRCFELIARTPKLGRTADEVAPGLRRHEHARHVIFYDEQPYGVLIVAIVHERSIRRIMSTG